MGRQKQLSEKTYTLLFWTVLAIGIAARVWRFGAVPGGLNQDEAFAGYEAWSLLNYGIDSAGYHFPVYLTAWGSGMNALNTYLMMPFIAAFGLKTWVIRLPQLITACLTLPAVYGIIRRISDRDHGLLAMFMLAVCPWHIMLSRWGLESNLAPGFLTFGLYFFVLGLDRPKYMITSALMYGLSLYAYATIWPFVPVILLLQIVYCVRCRKLRFDRYAVLSLLLLAVLALPLLLFLAVNFGFIEEIRLPFISVPKLLYMRSGEISFANIPQNFKTLFGIILTQSDGLPWNCADKFGQLYPVSLLFELIGLGACTFSLIKKKNKRSFRGEALILIQLIAALLLGLLISVNVNRVNILFIPRVLLASYGMYFIADKSGKRVLPVLAAVYAVFFICFEIYYFNDYSSSIAFYFGEGTEQAVDAAFSTDSRIYVSDDIYYPVVLFYSRTPTDEFKDNVEYVSYPAAYLRAKSFGRFEFINDTDEIKPDGVYILSQYDDSSPFVEAGFTLTRYGVMALAEP